MFKKSRHITKHYYDQKEHDEEITVLEHFYYTGTEVQ